MTDLDRAFEDHLKGPVLYMAGALFSGPAVTQTSARPLPSQKGLCLLLYEARYDKTGTIPPLFS